MTRAVKKILLFQFKDALELNPWSWIFIILIPIIALDFINILVQFKKIKLKGND